MLQMFHYQILMTMGYLFLTSTLQKEIKNTRSNNCNFMTKELWKAITNRSKLRNKFLKTRNEEPRRSFNIQDIFVLAYSTKLKDVFWAKLDHRVASENFGKLSVLSSRTRIFTKNPLFWITTTKVLVIMRN